MNCIRCGGPVAPIAGMPADRHADEIACWAYVRQEIADLRSCVNLLTHEVARLQHRDEADDCAGIPVGTVERATAELAGMPAFYAAMDGR